MSVAEHSARLRSIWREHIVPDFRDFRFSWSGLLKWTGVTLLALLVAALVTLYFLDWNQMRGPVARYLSHRTGREVRIDGNLSVKLFTWQPSVDAAGIYVGNPQWVGTPQAAKVKELRVELRLVPLIFGHLVLPLVMIDQPDILLVRDSSGRTNWDRGNQNPNEAWQLPAMQRFMVKDGHVRIEDAVRKLHFIGTVNSQEETNGARAAFSLLGDGSLNQNKFTADVKGGPLLHVDETRHYDFTADVHSGDTHAVVNGAITQPFHLDRFTAAIKRQRPCPDLFF